MLTEASPESSEASESGAAGRRHGRPGFRPAWELFPDPWADPKCRSTFALRVPHLFFPMPISGRTRPNYGETGERAPKKGRTSGESQKSKEASS